MPRKRFPKTPPTGPAFRKLPKRLLLPQRVINLARGVATSPKSGQAFRLYMTLRGFRPWTVYTFSMWMHQFSEAVKADKVTFEAWLAAQDVTDNVRGKMADAHGYYLEWKKWEGDKRPWPLEEERMTAIHESLVAQGGPLAVLAESHLTYREVVTLHRDQVDPIEGRLGVWLDNARWRRWVPVGPHGVEALRKAVDSSDGLLWDLGVKPVRASKPYPPHIHLRVLFERHQPTKPPVRWSTYRQGQLRSVYEESGVAGLEDFTGLGFDTFAPIERQV